MLGVALAILLWLLPSQVNGLITTDAKCLSGYDWAFSSIGQSPCDVAAELASVCYSGRYNLSPLEPDSFYRGPTPTTLDTCRCSTVYYSLLSACAYCQSRNYIGWSSFRVNCPTVQLTLANYNIPVGVKVPAYAYQNVSTSNSFNVTLAQSLRGLEESSRLPQAPSSTSNSSATSAAATQSSSSTNASTVNNTPAIIGGVVGGIVAIGFIATVIIFLVLRSRQKSHKYNSSFNPSLIQSLSPGSNADDRSSYPLDPIINDPNRPLPKNVPSNITGSSAQNDGPQTRQSHYSGMPEL